MSREEIFMNIGLGYGIMIYAFMFKEGLFRGKLNNRFRKVINLEELFFGNISEELGKKADAICFKITFLMSICIILNGVLGLIWHSVPTISFIFMIIAFPIVIIFRFLYVYLKK